MTRSSLKWEYDYKRSEEERETIEGSMEKLRSEMGKTDAKKKEFAEKVSFDTIRVIVLIFSTPVFFTQW